MRTGRIKPGYGIIQRDIMKLKIDVYAKAVYCLLVSYAGENDNCFPSLNTMCNDLSISKPKLIDSLKVLIKQGLIIADKRKTKNGDFTSNIYYPLMVMEENNDPTNDQEKVVNHINHVGNSNNYGVVNEVNPNNNNTYKSNTSSLFNNKEEGDVRKIFIDEFNKIKSSKYRLTTKLKKTLTQTFKDYNYKDLLQALKNAMTTEYHINNQFNDLTPEFFTRVDKIEKYINHKATSTPEQEEAKKKGVTVRI